MKTPRFWQSKNIMRVALLPVSCIYSIGAWLDRTRTTPKHAALPVISVGNVTAGGAGKTPVTLALIPMLRTLGHTPHILTRGYKGTALTAHRVGETDDWKTVGDEALLLAKAAPTWVGRDRFAAAQAAATSGATILVCDDALQHHALHKDISILVIDGPYGIGNGALIPAGPLREPLAGALARVDAVIIIGSDAQQLAPTMHQPVFYATLQPVTDNALIKTGKFLAFAGIGRPEKFYATLRELGAEIVATQDFADHHAYTDAEIRALITHAHALGATPLTTAKDFVKIPPALQPCVAMVPVALTLETPSKFNDFLINALSAIRAG